MKELYTFLTEAFNNKKRGDEFYTRMKDIEKELSHYDLKGKTIYCNCDNPEISNFWKYFHDNFDKLGIKHLYATFVSEKPKLYDYDGKDLKVEDIQSGKFEDNEDKIKKFKIDIIITNPPFSNKLPNQLIKMCIDNNVDFLIVAQLHLIQSKDIIELYKKNEIHVGYSSLDNFDGPNGETQKSAPCCWYTSLEVNHPKIKFTKEYNEDDYPKYDNYDAIDCKKWKDIPKEYDGNMGVPYRFITKLNHEQFEIVDIFRPKINGKNIFMKLIIRYK